MDHLQNSDAEPNLEETKALLADGRRIVTERDDLQSRVHQAFYGYQNFIVHYAAIFFNIGRPLTALTDEPPTDEQLGPVSIYMTQNNKSLFQIGDDIFAAMRGRIRFYKNMRNLVISMACASLITFWAAQILYNSPHSTLGIAVFVFSCVIDAIMIYIAIFKCDPRLLKEYSRRYDAFIGFHELAKRAKTQETQTK